MTKLKEIIYSELDIKEKYRLFNEENVSKNSHFLVSAIYTPNSKGKLNLENIIGDIECVDINMVLESFNERKEVLSPNYKKVCFYFESLDNNKFLLFIETSKKINLPEYRSLCKKYYRYKENEKIVSEDTMISAIMNNIWAFKDKIFLSKEIYDKNVLTEEQLVAFLKTKNLKFKDEKKAIEYLKHTSYYNFKEYSDIFLDENKMYKDNSYFTDILDRIELSKNLSAYLLYVISRIEDSIEVNFARLLSKNSPTEYLKYEWLKNKNERKRIDKSIFSRAKKLFLKESKLHDINIEFFEKYDLNSIPIIHLVEYIALGDLVELIEFTNDDIVDQLCNTYKLSKKEFRLTIKLLKELRNRLAHGNIIIDKTFPGFTKEYDLKEVLEKIEIIFNSINSYGIFKEDEQKLEKAKIILEKLEKVK
ncbi:Abi family protein [Oceanivirga miroungae]|uniref:Abi family protein n=1 Tax=Oceanivirga miroungae TaxID=1130046 RepID=A0A6I8MBM5_9FUSO|nr:Abi family protein [Oceanivirga miroungae]VWL84885.1 Abi family protein [Oceanivirga miroungae]